MIKDTFTVSNYHEESELGINKIQQLLLNMDDKKSLNAEIGESLFLYYQ